ncbi:MAG: M28 family metallopeptidase, partial [Saprospiraceae bacterium]|nr:M28 family metallopeptidase [Saprospiraceae bacterium]
MRFAFYILFLFILCQCAPQVESPPEINKSSIEKHMAALSSDEFLGRMPCTEGETKTVEYLTQALKDAGIAPGNKGSYLQDVPLLDINSTMESNLEITTPTKKISLSPGSDFVINTERKTDALSLNNSELVFCGYGIVAPERDWNDYEGLDMKGKTAVVLVNDPGYGGDDPNFFKGDIMTYYGRWTYKYDEADRQGADGLLIIHETSSAGYPWFVVQSSWTGSQQGLAGMDRSDDCGVKGWISLNAAKDLMSSSGQDLSDLIKQARQPGFKPVPLNAQASASISSENAECLSKNVIGIVEGSKYPDEYVLYTAHWDHIGVGKVVNEDSIYNGALDNASGTSTVLAIAESFAKSSQKPERSVVFLFVTAEEQGLLGSEYYAENPIYPLIQTVANLNMDGVNPAGLMNDLTIVGMGHSEMDDIAEDAAVKQGRYVINEQEPEKGYFFRSDQFNFAKKGVPVLYGEGGYDHKEYGKEYAKEFKEKYTAERYHAPADQYDPEEWNFEGMLQDGALYQNIGLRLANSAQIVDDAVTNALIATNAVNQGSI